MILLDKNVFFTESSGKLADYSCQAIIIHLKVTEFRIKHNMPTAFK